MIHQIINWRTGLATIAILIVTATIFYSQYVARKIEMDESKKVEAWVEAQYAINNPANTDIALPTKILTNNTDIPIILTAENDSIISYINLDSVKLAKHAGFLQNELKRLKKVNTPIISYDVINTNRKTYAYYGHTALLNEVRYYPIIQLFIVSLFIIVVLAALRSSYRSAQNLVWAGMAKETAHQLGTPVSSLEGWVEMLRDMEDCKKIVPELEKDVNRLRLVSDRFGKIGSTPQLEKTEVVGQIRSMVDYIKKRASEKVKFIFEPFKPQVYAYISPPLFDWVIENLLKNALDSMEGHGTIHISMIEENNAILIDVTDTGKGIQPKHIKKVFQPGFTTKKRGWGLGLSLSKRIISQYHKGEIFVKKSEPGIGTTFRIMLNKDNELH